jgi:sugar phosphate isomerase/epimerase
MASAMYSVKTPDSIFNNSTDRKVLFFATNWGFDGSIADFCKKAKEAGYDGIELWWSHDTKVQKEIFEALKNFDLKIGFLCAGSSNDFETHQTQFKEALTSASENNFKVPDYINCHSGKDFFNSSQNQKLIDITIAQQEKTGINILHETHRGRMCFAAHITQEFLKNNPKMNLTLDISHWTNVHESMLDNQPKAVELALSRTAHIHARVGHEQGPQVSDPFAPEWDYTFQKHLQWWDTVINQHASVGSKPITILTEFGPPNYMPTLPYTKQPVANQWEINKKMMNFLKNRYKQ